MKIKLFCNKRTRKTVFQDDNFNTHTHLLSSCPTWIILASSLWLVQTSSLRAMDDDREGSNFLKHPLTQESSKRIKLSVRLQQIISGLNDIKKEIFESDFDFTKFIETNLEKYKNVLKCSQCDIESAHLLKEIHLNHLHINTANPQFIGDGYSGNEVMTLPHNTPKIVIKKFKDIKQGLEELIYSLAALDINPAPYELKMARIYDAVLCPSDCLSIVMEGAESHKINAFLSEPESENVIKACAKYLATFHIKNHTKQNKAINRKKYLAYASKFFHTLTQNPLEEEKKEPKLLSLIPRKQDFDFEKVTSSNIIQLLSKGEQENFIYLVKQSRCHFEENSSAIFRLIHPQDTEKQKPYFLTITQGDAHGSNFFYDRPPAKIKDNSLEPAENHMIRDTKNDFCRRSDERVNKIPEDSFYRITMIDFASIIRTYGKVGDPAEDVGRFLGSLWEWSAQREPFEPEKISALQNLFIQSYLQKIKESKIVLEKDQKTFEKIFEENYNFYKLRFYRVIFNSKQNKEIKLRILRSWIQEASTPLDFDEFQQQESINYLFKITGLERTPDNTLIAGELAENLNHLPQALDLAAHYMKLVGGGDVTGALFKQYLKEFREEEPEMHSNVLHTFKNTQSELIYKTLIGKTFNILMKYLQKEVREVDGKIREMADELMVSYRHWEEAEGDVIIHDDLPDSIPAAEFIEAISREPNKSYLTLLWEKLYNTGAATLSSPVTIVGMGGVGKTSLALKYAHEAKAHKAYNLIHWISSGTDDFLLESCKNLLRKIPNIPLNISIKDLGKEDVIRLVNEYVPKQGKCLLVCDDVPNPTKWQKFLNGNELPQNVHILITSRCRKGWDDNTVIDLDEFQPKDSINYLFNITGLERTLDHETIAGELAEALAHLPRVLAHAAHYIKLVGSSNVTGAIFKEYLEDFKKQPPIKFFEENKNSFKEDKPQITYQNLIQKTLKINISKEDLNEIANKLLAYSAYLDSDFIEEDIFLEQWEEKEKIQEVLSLLSSLSLIKKTPHKSVFSICRLVQDVIRDKKELGEKLQYEEVFSQVVRIFNNLFKNNLNSEAEINKWVNKFHHILQLLEHSERLEILSQEVNELKCIGRIIFCFYCLSSDLKYKENKIIFQENIQKLEILERASSFFSKSFGNPTASNESSDWLEQLKQIRKSIEFFNHEFSPIQESDQILKRISPFSNKYFGNPIANNETLAWRWLKEYEQITESLKIFNPKFGPLQEHNQILERASSFFRKSFRKPMASNEIPEWLEKLEQKAEEIHPTIQLALSTMYSRGAYPMCMGEGDDKKSFFWAAKAAERGNINGQESVGGMYAYGTGVDKDEEEAIKWWQKAANQGSSSAQYAPMKLYLQNKEDKKAFLWASKAAEQGCGWAQVSLGSMYEHGKGVDKDEEKAIKLYIEAAKQGKRFAQFNLGVRYERGDGVRKDEERSAEWYAKAEEQRPWEEGIGQNVYNAGIQFEVCATNNAMLLLCLTEATHCGLAKDLYELGLMYYTSQGMQENNEETIQLSLSGMYYVDLGVKENNEEEAIRLFTRAAKKGHRGAQGILNIMDIPVYKEEPISLTRKGFYHFHKKENAPHIPTIATPEEEITTTTGGPTPILTSTPQLQILSSGGNSPKNDAAPQPTSSAASFDLSHASPVQMLTEKTTNQLPENNTQSTLWTEQGDRYTALALQHAKEGNIPLAEHCAAEANKKYIHAEDAKLAAKLQNELQ